ncbi:hypothetical protein OS889_07405 [Halobellus sp. MBLA0158]|uniref:DUF7260 domain-containing protein n=1 Tax=Halobellus rubicundus TaxID=2996466 RepID=A0ABD5MAY9_9EURY
MSLPFFEDEYAESYREALRREFGPEFETVLFNDECFTPSAKDALLDRIDRAKQQRNSLLRSCERELESVTDVGAELESIAEEVRFYEDAHFAEQDFGTLDAYRSHLLRLEDACEDLTADRQATIRHHRTTHGLTQDCCDLPEYLYDDLEHNYPILYLCSDVLGRVRELHDRTETAIVATFE